MILFENTEITDFDGLFKVAPPAVKQKLNDNKELRENPLHHPEENAFEHIKIVTNRLFDTKDINLILAGFFHDICKMESAEQRRKTLMYIDGLVSEAEIIEHTKEITRRLSDNGDINLTFADFFKNICKKDDNESREVTFDTDEGVIRVTEVISQWMLCKDHEKKAVDFLLRHVTWMQKFQPDIDLGKIIWIVNEHMRIKTVHEMNGKKKKEIIENKWFKDLVIFSKADRMLIEWDYPLLMRKMDVYKDDPENLVPSKVWYDLIKKAD